MMRVMHDEAMMHMMHDHGMTQWWGPWIVVWGVLMLTLWGLVLAALGLVVRWLWQRTSHSAVSDRPLDVARLRYARGEITPDEFEAIRRDLGV